MVQCTSLKSNMGHLEACAAAAGLASLLLAPLGVTVAAANAQLRRYFCMHRLIFWILFVVTLFQAERTFVIDRIVEIVVLLGARRGGGALGMPCRFGDRSRGVSSGSPELVWIQRDHRPRGFCALGAKNLKASKLLCAGQVGFPLSHLAATRLKSNAHN